METEKGISTKFLHPDPVINVWFDPTQMQQVFHHLLTNAFKLSPEKGWVSVEITPRHAEIVVSVTNSGIGLAVSKSIVDLFDGLLSVASTQPNDDQDVEPYFTLKLLTNGNPDTTDHVAKNEAIFTNGMLSPRTDERSITGDKFISKLRGLVIDNISRSDFGVNEMALQVGMSLSVLYRKVRSLTGTTVNDFMKTIKMQKALQLLESGSYHVSEVSLMVGYEDVRHFSKEFKKIYGKNPSQSRSPSVE